MRKAPLNVTQTLIQSRLESGSMIPGHEIALRIDQVLLQDVLGALVMLELEAIGVERVNVPLAAQYIDHNLLEADNLSADEHVFLRSACRRFGIWYSRAGNGISHPVHMQRFGKPGETLIGGDSHTAAAGSLGMLAFGAGGVDVAMALSGEPAHLTMPAVIGVKLTGELPGPGLPDTQPVRRELVRRVIALDPVIDEVIGESSQLRYHSPVLQSAVDGLFAVLAGWRTLAVHLARLPVSKLGFPAAGSGDRWANRSLPIAAALG
jgi:hypothetical protein